MNPSQIQERWRGRECTSEDSISDSSLERSVVRGFLGISGGGGGGAAAGGGRGGVGKAMRNGAGMFILFIKCKT
jgi:hypothetical protein